MKSLYFFLPILTGLLSGFLCDTVQAQQHPRNAIFVEGVTFGMVSVNYERDFKRPVGLYVQSRQSFEYDRNLQKPINPIMEEEPLVNFHGNGRLGLHLFFAQGVVKTGVSVGGTVLIEIIPESSIGIGGSIIYVIDAGAWSFRSVEPSSGSGFTALFPLTYRYQPLEGGITVRAGISPFLDFNLHTTIGFNVGIGYCF